MNVHAKTFQHIWSVKIAALFVLFVVAYWIPLKGIVAVWWTNQDYQYGFLIPLISAYLLWDKQATVRKLHARSSWIILPVLVFFVLLSLYGILGSSGNISRPAIPILVILFVAFCFGIHVAWKLIPPLGFLVFMVPLPEILERTLGVYLKAVSAKLGAEIIRAFGITVHLSGNVIDLGITEKLEVVDACSGLRYILPLLALGVLFAYLFEKIRWKQVFLVLSTIPIAVVTNGIRIGITGILAVHYGSEVATGFYEHRFTGWVLFMVAFGLLLILGRFLRLFPPNPSAEMREKGSEIGPEPTTQDSHKGINKAFCVSVFLLMMVGLLTWSTKALPPVQIKGGINSFPVEFAGWTGKSEAIDPLMIRKSGAEEAFSASYGNNRYGDVSLYLGYRASAFLENENFFHSPTVCLPAGGWKPRDISRHEIHNVTQFQELTVTRMIIETMGMRHLVYFWFQTKTKATYNKDINRFHLSLHAIQRDNTYDLFIRPITPLLPNETVQEAENRMDQFVRDMMDALLNFLAENQEKGG
jgi:exosortase D (VPLPA-CTERM-specific)